MGEGAHGNILGGGIGSYEGVEVNLGYGFQENRGGLDGEGM